MKTPPEVAMIKAYADSPLALVNQILLSGKFSPAPDKAVGENETLIGELTAFEKALLTARNNNARIYNDMVETQTDDNKPLIGLTQEMCDALNSLFWVSVKQRLGAPAIECDGIGIRQDYKVVQVPDDQTGASVRVIGCSDPMLSMLLGELFANR